MVVEVSFIHFIFLKDDQKGWHDMNKQSIYLRKSAAAAFLTRDHWQIHCVVLDCQHDGPSIAITALNTELQTRYEVVVESVWVCTG